jgi:hypothetical protein
MIDGIVTIRCGHAHETTHTDPKWAKYLYKNKSLSAGFIIENIILMNDRLTVSGEQIIHYNRILTGKR